MVNSSVTDLSNFVLPSQEGLSSQEIVQNYLSKIESCLEVLLSQDYIADMHPGKGINPLWQTDLDEISDAQTYLYEKLVLISDLVKIAKKHCDKSERPKKSVKIVLNQLDPGGKNEERDNGN